MKKEENSQNNEIPSEILEVYNQYLPETRQVLLEIRSLIFDIAAERNNVVGEITETLKWGEPAYLTSELGSGSTIRLGCLKKYPEQPTSSSF